MQPQVGLCETALVLRMISYSIQPHIVGFDALIELKACKARPRRYELRKWDNVAGSFKNRAFTNIVLIYLTCAKLLDGTAHCSQVLV